MRRMVEALKHEQVSLVDGIMVTVDETRWVQILPDADDPVFHLYAEGRESEDAAALIETYRHRLEVVIEERAFGRGVARAAGPPGSGRAGVRGPIQGALWYPSRSLV